MEIKKVLGAFKSPFFGGFSMLKKAFLLQLGLVYKMFKNLEQKIKELENKEEIIEKYGKEAIEKLEKKLIMEKEELLKEIQKVIKELNLVTQDEIKELKRELEILKEEIQEIKEKLSKN